MNEIAVDGKRVNYIRREANKVLEFLSAEPLDAQKVILELALADTKGRLALTPVSFNEAVDILNKGTIDKFDTDSDHIDIT